jgi:hypothetical protein
MFLRNAERTTWRYIQEDCTLHNHHREKLKSHTRTNLCETVYIHVNIQTLASFPLTFGGSCRLCISNSKKCKKK